MTEILANKRVLSKNYPMNTNMTGFRWFSKIFASLCFGQKEPQHWKGYMILLPHEVIYVSLCRFLATSSKCVAWEPA